MEIAHDLAEGGASKVWLSARTPPNIVLREGPGGLPGDMIAVVLLHLDGDQLLLDELADETLEHLQVAR